MARVCALMWGPPGCGKTTAIRDAGLESCRVSFDMIREQVTGWVGTVDGEDQLWLNRHLQTMVGDIAHRMVEARMMQGLPVVVDATNLKHKLVRPFVELAKAYGYEPVLVDCWEPDHVLFARNAQRGRYAIEGYPSKLAKAHRYVPYPGVRMVRRHELAALVAHPRHDWSQMDRVMVVGDVHSRSGVLRRALAQTDVSSTMVVFVGDLTDRGPDPVGVVETVLALPHAHIVRGNHEWSGFTTLTG